MHGIVTKIVVRIVLALQEKEIKPSNPFQLFVVQWMIDVELSTLSRPKTRTGLFNIKYFALTQSLYLQT